MPSPMHLIDRAFVAVHGVHHALQRGVEESLGGFRIAVGQDQFRRALEVGKQHGDLLALAFQRAARGEDFLREIGRGVGEGCRSRGLHGRRGATGAGPASPVQTRTCASSSTATLYAPR